MNLHFYKLESPSPKDAFSKGWLKLAHWFWRRRKCGSGEEKNVKKRWTYEPWVIRKSSLELSAQVS